MTFLTTPERTITTMGCSCTSNSGTVTDCTQNSSICGAKCHKFEICVTPTGLKMQPEGIGAAS